MKEISVELLRAINDELIAISETTEGQKGMATTLDYLLETGQLALEDADSFE